MKIQFHNLKGQEISSSLYTEGRFLFTASRPAVVQPAEIIKVQTDLVVRLPTGCILNLSTAPNLYRKVGELFPGLLSFSFADNDVVLELPVRNGGRNPLHLREGEEIAVGYLVKTEKAEIETFSLQAPKNLSAGKSRPPKKNPGINFELK